ncbi:hypothetical protein DES41_111108 [Pseudorhodoferax soli]|uniref:Uncharacterized protein n=1 Tax=Pseudorhodoferax soli TaxID=545864 RepID=A0A368XDX4_9BURK|nr:hypothetical protein DES41_111108 [Pseudorhodoferax soli]
MTVCVSTPLPIPAPARAATTQAAQRGARCKASNGQHTGKKMIQLSSAHFVGHRLRSRQRIQTQPRIASGQTGAVPVQRRSAARGTPTAAKFLLDLFERSAWKLSVSGHPIRERWTIVVEVRAGCVRAFGVVLTPIRVFGSWRRIGPERPCDGPHHRTFQSAYRCAQRSCHATHRSPRSDGAYETTSSCADHGALCRSSLTVRFLCHIHPSNLIRKRLELVQASLGFVPPGLTPRRRVHPRPAMALGTSHRALPSRRATSSWKPWRMFHQGWRSSSRALADRCT